MYVEQYNSSHPKKPLPLDSAEIQVSRRHPEVEPTSEQEIVELILNDDSYVQQALMMLYRRQEDDEQVQRKTIHKNGVGFNAADANVFTPIAERVLAGGPLSLDDFDKCRKLMKNGLPRLAHYRGQLLKAQKGRVQ